MTDIYWNQSDAVELCRMLEVIAPANGCHVALTGGLLYKEGLRKDCDIVIYRIRQCEQIDALGLLSQIHDMGFTDICGFGFVTKARWQGKRVDFLFPEHPSGIYKQEMEKLP